MGLESVNHISDLNVANPLSGDNVSQGDDHIRNIKKALLTDFPNINETVNATPTQLDYTAVTTLGTAEAAKALTVSLASTMTFNGMTIADLGTVTTADIDGGTIDGAVIGGNSAAAVSATALAASASLVLATGATVTGIDDDDTMAADSASILPTQAAAKGYADSILGSVLAGSRAANGYIEFKIAAGLGIAVNWGVDSSSGGSGSDTFTKAYSATAYTVVLTPDATGSPGADTVLNSITSTGFTYDAAPGGGITAIYWIAIGPTTI